MSEKKLANIYYADLWGIQSEKYKYLQENDVTTTKWQELKPAALYLFCRAPRIMPNHYYEVKVLSL
jgi:hypothetical protein